MWITFFSCAHIPDCSKLLCFRYYNGSTLDCLAQTQPLIIKEPPDRFKRFVKVRHKPQRLNGIENDAFQDECCDALLKKTGSLEDLTKGAKKKSPAAGLRRSESSCASGAKKKVRHKTVPAASGDEYYQIWAATSWSPKKVEEDEAAPPLPPRALHRPLERSNAVNGKFCPCFAGSTAGY